MTTMGEDQSNMIEAQELEATAAGQGVPAHPNIVFNTDGLGVYYGTFRAVREVNLQIKRHDITAFIGPSGCGKTTVLRCFNRMNDLIPGARIEGSVRYHGVDLYGRDVAAQEVRR